jgi:hypothetical protein
VTVTAGTQATDRGAGDWGGGSSTLTFTGTLAQLQAALDTVEYVPGDDPDTSETITVTFNDLNNAGAGSAGGGSDVHSVEHHRGHHQHRSGERRADDKPAGDGQRDRRCRV